MSKKTEAEQEQVIAKRHAEIARRRNTPEEKVKRIVAAARDFHRLVHETWEEDDGTIIQNAADQLHAIYRRGMSDGEETEGWYGGCLTQADGAMAALYLLEIHGAKGDRFRA